MVSPSSVKSTAAPRECTKPGSGLPRESLNVEAAPGGAGGRGASVGGGGEVVVIGRHGLAVERDVERGAARVHRAVERVAARIADRLGRVARIVNAIPEQLLRGERAVAVPEE